MFTEFSVEPVASASVAQVHLARLPDGRDVAVKILRPDMRDVIDHDIALLDTLAGLVEKVWSDGKRLKPREVVAEFAKYLRDELDLMREASNCSQLRAQLRGLDAAGRAGSALGLVHAVGDGHGAHARHPDQPEGRACRRRRRPQGAVACRRRDLLHAGLPRRLLPRRHAPRQHLRRHRRRKHGRYIALDFGIVGTLTDTDKNYLAQNFLAFFQRDYKRVAQAHIEAGWAPADTREDEFEAAIRAVCEPIFDRPLKEISFGKVLLRLFQTSRRFNVEIQPQLVMLQKTLLNIEGLGRQLDPDLDLWKTAKPFLERWMSEQVGLRGLKRQSNWKPRTGRTPCRSCRASYLQALSRPAAPDLSPPSSPRSPPASAGRTPCWHSSPPCSPAFSSHRSSSDFAFRGEVAAGTACAIFAVTQFKRSFDMHQVAISGTGLWVAPNVISNEELVAAFNAYAAAIQRGECRGAIAAGTVAAIPESSAEFVEKASGIKQRLRRRQGRRA